MSFIFSYNPPESEIVELRHRAFEEFYTNKVKLDGLNWNMTDRNSCHVGLYKSNVLICCLRVSIFNDLQKLQTVTQIILPENTETAPYVLLSRAATHPDYKNLGLHSILRCRALELCAHFNLTNIWGSLEKRSLRLPQLINIGYKIVAESEKWPDSYIQNTGDVVLIHLSGPSLINQAIASLKLKHQLNSLTEFPQELCYP